MSERERSFTKHPPRGINTLVGGFLFFYKPLHYPWGCFQLTQVNQFWENAATFPIMEKHFLISDEIIFLDGRFLSSQDTRRHGDHSPGRGRAAAVTWASGWVSAPCDAHLLQGVEWAKVDLPAGSGGSVSVGKEGPLGRRGACVSGGSSGLCTDTRTHLETANGTWWRTLNTQWFIKSVVVPCYKNPECVLGLILNFLQEAHTVNLLVIWLLVRPLCLLGRSVFCGNFYLLEWGVY